MTFHSALSRPPADREAYLVEACADDEDSLRELRLLLAAHEAAGDFLKTDAPLSPETDAETALMGEPSAMVLATERPAVLIGRYKLVKELGKGGFGVVWQAEQTEPIRREVALKIIKPGMDSREIIARFEAERQALALMDHPNIAAVLDAGATDRGLPYFVMELVKGTPITEYCDARKLGIRERLELFIPVCQAVQHAHQKAILHRDLKPSNILVTEVDGKPVPKVIDFGIAKALHATDEPALHATLARTLDGMIVGTPQYMSPEQAGSVPDVDTRSDIYTLGVILYELLVGETPLSREQLKNAALDVVLRLVREGEPRRPSSRFTPATELAKTTATSRHTEPKKLGHALRGDLDWIVLKALEKDRARRYDTANDFALDLQRHLNDEPVSAGPPSAGYRLRKLVRRNRLAFGAAAAILVMLAAGITVSTWQAVRATKAEKLAEGRRMQAESAATQARESLSQSDFLQALRSINEDKTRDALAQLARSLAVNPQNDASLYRLTTLLTYRSFALPISRIKHDGWINSAQFSPDGKQITTAAGNSFAAPGNARVWDAQSGQPLTALLQHEGEVTSAEFNPDGKQIVTASWDKTARVWDAQSGQVLTGPLQHDGIVSSAHFSSDGKWIVTASRDKTARAWDAQNGQPITKPLPHDGEVTSARFSPDGKSIVTTSRDNLMRVWDTASGKQMIAPVNQPDGNWVGSAEFSPDGKRIVSTAGCGRVMPGTARVWDAQNGQPLTEPMKHEREVYSAKFSPDGKRIVTTSDDNITRVWDAQSGQLLKKNADWVEGAEFSPDGKWIVSASRHTAQVWDAQSGQALIEPMERDRAVVSARFREIDPMQFSPDGKRVVSVSDGKIARVWDAHSGQPLTGLMKHEGVVQSAQFSPDGRLILTFSDDKTARVWDAHSGRPLTVPLRHDEQVWSAQFSPDGKVILTTSREDKTMRLWDAQRGQLLIAPIKYDGRLTTAEFSPDGKQLVTTSSGLTARVWDVKSGQTLTETIKHDGTLWSAKFSPDGKWIVTASRDATARVWDALSGLPLTDPMRHDDAVHAAQFSADGKRIVTESGFEENEMTRVWDAKSGQPLTEWMKRNGLIELAQFSPGKKQTTTSEGNTLHVTDSVLESNRVPEWLPRLAEAVAGKRLNDRGVFELLSADPGWVLEELRAQLSRAPADDDWAIWGRWFLADRSTRTISPFSKFTVPEYIENRIKENTPKSLAEAERLAVGNAELLQRIAQAREAPAAK